MDKAKAIGRLEMRIDEVETIHIKGKRKDDPERKWAEGYLEGLKEGLLYIKGLES